MQGMAQQKVLEQAKALVLKWTTNEPVCVYLFGSRAKGNYGKYSDIDLAILSSGAMPPGLIGRLKCAFEESNIPYSVDVIDLTEVDEQFRNRVISEGILWKDWKSDLKQQQEP